MLFLIEYDRRTRERVTFEVFDDADRSVAQNKRLDLELKLNRSKIDREVVILEASSEDALRRTHQRYFEDLDDILESAREILQTNGHE